MGKEISFTVSFVNNNLNSPYIIQKPLSVMRVYCMPRTSMQEWAKLDGTDGSGIYFLLGNNRIYAGKTEQGIVRLKQHLHYKLWWDKAIMFLASPKHFNLSFISELEWYAINDIKANSPYIVENEQIPCIRNISSHEMSLIEDVYEEIKFMLNFLGVKTQTEDERESLAKQHVELEKIPVSNYPSSLTLTQLEKVFGDIIDKADPSSWEWMSITEFKNTPPDLALYSVEQIGRVAKSMGIQKKSMKKGKKMPLKYSYLPK